MESPVITRPVGCLFQTIRVFTREPREFIDITDDVTEVVDAADLENGLAVIASKHTTAAIVVNEHEPELLKDLERLLREVAPETGDYAHNAVPCAVGERPNGHAHCQALFLTTSATIPIVAGRLALGRYQRIFLVELDFARPREVSVMVLGT